MADRSMIEWTDATWSPVLGCTPASAGCASCYAVRDVWRMAHNPNQKIASARTGLVEKTAAGVLRWTGKVNCLHDQLDVPLHWRAPRRIFVCNQADLFHEAVPEEFIDRVFDMMERAGWHKSEALSFERPGHTFQVLTKRPARMLDYVTRRVAKAQAYADKFKECPTPEMRNSPAAKDAAERARTLAPCIWLGVSVEDQAAADERIPPLLAAPAAHRFLSCEPLLGPVSLEPIDNAIYCEACGYTRRDMLEQGDHRLCKRPGPGIDWVIAGGESGPRARTCDLEWIAELVEACQLAGVPVFVKQLGARPNTSSRWSEALGRITHRKGADPAEWPEDLRVQEVPRG